MIRYLRLTGMNSQRLTIELSRTEQQVEQLSGLWPICFHCKRNRDDEGYWNAIEVYVAKHTGASFNDSACQECAEKGYPEYHLYDED